MTLRTTPECYRCRVPDPDLSGAVLDGRYRVIEPIARGAMGAVYRGERLKLGRAVAIKIMHDALPTELASRERFEREAKLMARLEHPHCVSVIDFGLHDDKPFLVMDLVRGTSVLELLEKAGRLPPQRVADLIRQVLSGLAHAHELGIVHRDIKPANIMVTEKIGLGEQVRILDFGLARPASESTKLTAGIVVGTPNYMSPEQIKGEDVDGRADLYACGVMLFELLVGRKPFLAGDPLGVVRMHLHDVPPTLASAAPDLEASSELEAVVARALAKDRAKRFSTAEEMATALSAAVPQPVISRAPSWSGPVKAPPVVVPDSISTTIPTQRQHRPRFTQQQLALGGVVLVLVLIMIIAATRGGVASPTAVSADAMAVVAQPPPIDAALPGPVSFALANASDLYTSGELDPALDVVTKARRVHPESAQLAFLGGKIYFAKLWWADGIKSFRDAIHLDPGYRTDPELVQLAIRAFTTTPETDARLADFLADDLGAPAKPLLEQTAKRHPNATVRARATAELRRLQ